VHDIGTFLNASALRRAHFSEVQRKLIEDRRIAEEESTDVENFVENDDEGSDEELKTKRYLLVCQAPELGSYVRL
jgi:hypothetical protein